MHNRCALPRLLCVIAPMPRKFLKKYLPDPARLREHRHLRVFGQRLADPNLWHLNRRSVARGALIGMFCAFLPMPMQMLPAAFLAIAFRANLPITILLVWLTNPLTMLPAFYGTYTLGTWLMGIENDVALRDLSVDTFPAWAWANFKPLVLGSLVTGVILAVTSYLAANQAWRLHVRREWKARRERRAARRQERDRD